MKKILLFVMVLVCALTVNAQSVATQKHEVQSGETLYSIARQYQVTVAALLEMNPGLQADYIMAGQKINVPATGAGQVATSTSVTPSKVVASVPAAQNRPKYKTLHEVQKKETIYSLCRQYGVTEEQLKNANPDLKKNKLKKGTVLNIPYSAEEEKQYQDEQRRIQEEAMKPKVQKYAAIKVAVILPFSLAEEKMSAESQKMTNLYQGFLLAVDSLKQSGYNVEVHAYDEVSASTPVGSILNKSEMKDMQLIIGPIRQWNVGSVAKFAHENHIAHVVPLSNELALVNEHTTTFQINVPYSLMYSQVYNRFYLMHQKHNIIFVGMNDKSDNMAYVNDFRADLNTKGVQYSNVNINEIASIVEMMKPGVNNVVIPSSGSAAAFENLCKKLDGLNLSSEYPVQLFGYPEWQTFVQKHERQMAKYQCQFFTSFYSNSAAGRTQQFNSRFRRWFNQEQYNSFPKYGELGYDIGIYFLKGLKEYGSAFYENLHNYSYFPLEFPLNFEKKNSWSGFQNKSILIVTTRTDGSVLVK